MRKSKRMSGLEYAEEILGVTLTPLDRGLNLHGKALVINPWCLREEYRKPEFLVWDITGGFGCDPDAIGTGTFGTCRGDGEHAKWERGSWVAECPEK